MSDLKETNKNKSQNKEKERFYERGTLPEVKSYQNEINPNTSLPIPKIPTEELKAIPLSALDPLSTRQPSIFSVDAVESIRPIGRSEEDLASADVFNRLQPLPTVQNIIPVVDVAPIAQNTPVQSTPVIGAIESPLKTVSPQALSPITEVRAPLVPSSPSPVQALPSAQAIPSPVQVVPPNVQKVAAYAPFEMSITQSLTPPFKPEAPITIAQVGTISDKINPIAPLATVTPLSTVNPILNTPSLPTNIDRIGSIESPSTLTPISKSSLFSDSTPVSKVVVSVNNDQKIAPIPAWVSSAESLTPLSINQVSTTPLGILNPIRIPTSLPVLTPIPQNGIGVPIRIPTSLPILTPIPQNGIGVPIQIPTSLPILTPIPQNGIGVPIPDKIVSPIAVESILNRETNSSIEKVDSPSIKSAAVVSVPTTLERPISIDPRVEKGRVPSVDHPVRETQSPISLFHLSLATSLIQKIEKSTEFVPAVSSLSDKAEIHSKTALAKESLSNNILGNGAQSLLSIEANEELISTNPVVLNNTHSRVEAPKKEEEALTHPYEAPIAIIEPPKQKPVQNSYTLSLFAVVPLPPPVVVAPVETAPVVVTAPVVEDPVILPVTMTQDPVVVTADPVISTPVVPDPISTPVVTDPTPLPVVADPVTLPPVVIDPIPTPVPIVTNPTPVIPPDPVILEPPVISDPAPIEEEPTFLPPTAVHPIRGEDPPPIEDPAPIEEEPTFLPPTAVHPIRGEDPPEVVDLDPMTIDFSDFSNNYGPKIGMTALTTIQWRENTYEVVLYTNDPTQPYAGLISDAFNRDPNALGALKEIFKTVLPDPSNNSGSITGWIGSIPKWFFDYGLWAGPSPVRPVTLSGGQGGVVGLPI